MSKGLGSKERDRLLRLRRR